MPEKPVRQEDRSAVVPKDNRAAEPQPSTAPDRDARADGAEKPEDEKRIERFRER